MIRRGFTVVELIITITIMGILLLLTVVNVNASQVNARNDERIGDIGAIQLYLENFAKTGSPIDGQPGRYPTTALTSSQSLLVKNLPDADLKSFTAPGAANSTATFIAATNASQNVDDVLPQPTISQYVYQPIDSSAALCTSGTDCRKYNLYYRLEATDLEAEAVHMVTSKNQ